GNQCTDNAGRGPTWQASDRSERQRRSDGGGVEGTGWPEATAFADHLYLLAPEPARGCPDAGTLHGRPEGTGRSEKPAVVDPQHARGGGCESQGDSPADKPPNPGPRLDADDGRWVEAVGGVEATGDPGYRKHENNGRRSEGAGPAPVSPNTQPRLDPGDRRRYEASRPVEVATGAP